MVPHRLIVGQCMGGREEDRLCNLCLHSLLSLHDYRDVPVPDLVCRDWVLGFRMVDMCSSDV